jgi:purine-binding chemotaxis protein CheW
MAVAVAALASPAGTGQLALLIPVGDDTYAVPLEKVREVAVEPAITRLPTAPPVVIGVFNLRGEILPLFDTGLLLGLRPVQACAYAVLVETAHGTAGLAATEMPLTVRLSESVGRSDLEATTETFMVGDRRLAVALDVEALLSPARISR